MKTLKLGLFMCFNEQGIFFSFPFPMLFISPFYYCLVFCLSAFLVINYNLNHCIFYRFCHWLFFWIKEGTNYSEAKCLQLGKDTKKHDEMFLNYFLNLVFTKGKDFLNIKRMYSHKLL